MLVHTNAVKLSGTLFSEDSRNRNVSRLKHSRRNKKTKLKKLEIKKTPTKTTVNIDDKTRNLKSPTTHIKQLDDMLSGREFQIILPPYAVLMGFPTTAPSRSPEGLFIYQSREESKYHH